MFDIYLSIINIILSIISVLIVIYAFVSGKKLHSFVMKIFIIFIISSSCIAQEDVAVDSRALVLPEAFVEGSKIIEDRAREVVDYVFEDDMWRQSAYMFLYGGNNTTIKLHGPKDIII